MENIYTIKVKTNPDPRSLYPSERRYSASTVLGLSVVHLALATTILLLASLSLTTHTAIGANEGYETVNKSVHNVTDERNDDVTLIDDDEIVEERIKEKRNSQFVNLTLSPAFMAIGAIAAGLTGLLSWKKWYVDHNIRWFFFMSSLSIINSLVCFIITCITMAEMIEQRSLSTHSTFIFSFNNNNMVVDRLGHDSTKFTRNGKNPNIRLVLAVNLLIASFLELAWSILSTKISFYGMKNNYPDDIVLSRGKIEVNTVHKGNKNNKTVAPDILNHHPKKRKFDKYFPKNDNGFLPKQESNNEYRDRVNKFLYSNSNES